MQKLRDLYRQTQRFAKQNFDKVTPERMKKILAYCNKEFEAILAKNDYTDLDEVTFYKEKFTYIVETYELAMQQNLKKTLIQEQIIDILKDDYIPQGQVKVQTNIQQTNSQFLPPPAANGDGRIVQNTKNMIQTYFDNKNQQIQRSKIGFKSVLEGIPYIPKKFGVKPTQVKKVSLLSHPDRTEEIQQLQTEIQKLKSEIASKQNEKQLNMQHIQREKKVYEDRIKKLTHQLNQLQLENTRLKEQSVKNYPIYEYEPIIKPQEQPMVLEEDYSRPYHTKYRQNDINKLKLKHGQPYSPKPIRDNSQRSFTPSNKDLKQQYMGNKNPLDYLEIAQYPSNIQQIHRKDSNSMINSSSSKSIRSKSARDDAKSIALKSKISFFKPSMIIYRCEDFQTAVKSVDIIQLQVKRISIFVNNKSNLQKQVKFQYKYDNRYYELKVRKKLTVLDGKTQAKEEVQVKLINQTDLDSLIQVRANIDTRQLTFLLPAMFIQFLEKRPLLDKTAKYSSQQVNPIHQFADLSSASQLLPIEKLYGQLYESGRIYAISKHHEGYITFRWIGGQVNVETISPWRLFICYLLLKEY